MSDELSLSDAEERLERAVDELAAVQDGYPNLSTDELEMLRDAKSGIAAVYLHLGDEPRFSDELRELADTPTDLLNALHNHDDMEPMTDGGPKTSEPAVSFTEDVTLKPHPNELASAINGDHVVRFHLKDYTVVVLVDGRPDDGDHWNPKTEDDTLRWTEVPIPAEVATALATGDRDVYRTTVNGADIRLRAEVRE